MSVALLEERAERLSLAASVLIRRVTLNPGKPGIHFQHRFTDFRERPFFRRVRWFRETSATLTRATLAISTYPQAASEQDNGKMVALSKVTCLLL